METLGDEPLFEDNLFHRLGAMTEEALSPLREEKKRGRGKLERENRRKGHSCCGDRMEGER